MATVAIVGAGVIGAGWVARFALHGWDVQVFDPNPQTQNIVDKTLARAAEHQADLTGRPVQAGEVRVVDSLAAALEGVSWVQESLPEDVVIKTDLLGQLDRLLPAEVNICSSTSGFKPSVLGAELEAADRLFVCHPFNPVYLIPLVEVVPHVSVSEERLGEVIRILENLEMRPLRVRHEIDGHIADRLLEAVWREALWLVHDDVATTEEIDAAIKYGFGLRWAQMGLFETYLLGGGEAGMRHFLAQFGPALAWPWSKLVDVPDLDDELIEKIATQVEAQAGSQSIEALTEQRDRNLVAILKALEQD